MTMNENHIFRFCSATAKSIFLVMLIFTVALSVCMWGREAGAGQTVQEKAGSAPIASGDLKWRVIFIAIDSLNPAYLNYNKIASGPGSDPSNWLMPAVRSFCKQGALWPNARSNAPYVTDPNHLNALAATNAGQTGINGVKNMLTGWDAAGAVFEPIDLSLARYPNGEYVQTFFDLLRAGSFLPITTAFVGNKFWVPGEYGPDPMGVDPVRPPTVDIVVTGTMRPDYVAAPETRSYYDNPSTDPDYACDPESDVQTRVLNVYQQNPAQFPSDHWVVDAALQVLRNKNPDVIYIHLGATDTGQHKLGSLADPSDWFVGPAPKLPAGCEQKSKYRLRSRRNPNLFKEPILDLVRDVDTEFGRLIATLKSEGFFNNSIVVLLSDHNMETLLSRKAVGNATDVKAILQNAGVYVAPQDFFFSGFSTYGALYWREQPGTDISAIVAQAESVLRGYEAVNPLTGQLETPWYIINRDEMIAGRPDLGIAANELFHPYYAARNAWPHLIIMARNGWYFPALDIIDVAGHGSVETCNIVLAIKGMGYPAGATCAGEARISDISATLADYFGLRFPYDVVGRRLNCP